jgi:hypothetical protein
MTGGHRFAWELAYGPIPDGLWVLHHCDNPPCVNIDHLYLGTVKDNTADMMRRGRMRHYFRENPGGASAAGKVGGKPATR